LPAVTDLAELPRTDSGAGQLAPRFLSSVYEAASQCNKCSLCQAVCPTYVVNPVEWETARGRVALVRDAIEGRLSLSDIADGPLSTCLTCNNCIAACAPGVPTGDIVSAARAELHEQEGHSLAQSIAFRSILARPAVLRMLHTLSRATQAVGLHGFVRRTGLTRWLGMAGAFADHVGPLSKHTAYQRARRLPQPDGEIRGQVGFVVCCYENMAAPESTEASMRLLLANGFALDVPELGCSGLPAKSLGDRDAMLDMAIRNIERLRELDVDAFVGDVASCTGHVRRYGEMLGDDRLVGLSARRVGSRTWQLSTFLARHGLTAPLGRLRWKVAIDEPCSLPLDAEARGAARQLLSAIPGIQLMPLGEAAMCCGGPGTYFRDQPERSAAILARKFENVAASGADVLVTENISCLLQLREGARLYAPTLRVMHLSEVLMASIEVERRRHEVTSQR
jgi:glycolate oxidase iron-sulfur subunit